MKDHGAERSDERLTALREFEQRLDAIVAQLVKLKEDLSATIRDHAADQAEADAEAERGDGW